MLAVFFARTNACPITTSDLTDGEVVDGLEALISELKEKARFAHTYKQNQKNTRD